MSPSSTRCRTGRVFNDTNLRKAWQRACVAVGLERLTDIEGTHDKRYTGLIIHDLRRSATRNLIAAGVSEKVAMTISGHETREIFDRSHIVDSADVRNAMRRMENNQGQKSLVPVSVKISENAPCGAYPTPRKCLIFQPAGRSFNR